MFINNTLSMMTGKSVNRRTLWDIYKKLNINNIHFIFKLIIICSACNYFKILKLKQHVDKVSDDVTKVKQDVSKVSNDVSVVKQDVSKVSNDVSVVKQKPKMVNLNHIILLNGERVDLSKKITKVKQDDIKVSNNVYDVKQKPKMVNLDDISLLNSMTDEQLDIHHKAEMKRLRKKRVQRDLDKNKSFFG